VQTTSEFNFITCIQIIEIESHFIGWHHLLFMLNNLLVHNLLIYLLKLFSLAYPSFFLCLVPYCVYLFAMINKCWCKQMLRLLVTIKMVEMLLCSLGAFVIALSNTFCLKLLFVILCYVSKFLLNCFTFLRHAYDILALHISCQVYFR